MERKKKAAEDEYSLANRCILVQLTVCLGRGEGCTQRGWVPTCVVCRAHLYSLGSWRKPSPTSPLLCSRCQPKFGSCCAELAFIDQWYVLGCPRMLQPHIGPLAHCRFPDLFVVVVVVVTRGLAFLQGNLTKSLEDISTAMGFAGPADSTWLCCGCAASNVGRHNSFVCSTM